MTQSQQSARRRYNDKDIAADYDRLRKIADNYLVQYLGTWEPLLAAKQAVISQSEFTIEQLRMVCNTMLADSSVINMPEPIGHLMTFDASDYDDDDYPLQADNNVIQFPVKQTLAQRPMRIEMRSGIVEVNRFWYSLQTNAYLIHIGIGCRVRWCTDRYYINGRIPPYHRRFELNLRAFCKEWGAAPSEVSAACKRY